MDKEVEQVIRHSLRELELFVLSPEFSAVLHEMAELPAELRHEFCDLVLMSQEELARRGVRVPDDVMIQRSFFSDDRPTIFCVSKYLPAGYPWKKVTLTFDNPLPGSFRAQFHEVAASLLGSGDSSDEYPHAT